MITPSSPSLTPSLDGRSNPTSARQYYDRASQLNNVPGIAADHGIKVRLWWGVTGGLIQEQGDTFSAIMNAEMQSGTNNADMPNGFGRRRNDLLFMAINCSIHGQITYTGR